MLKQLFILVLLSSIVGCAGAKTGESLVNGEADRPKRDCIFRSSIRGYSILNESNLIVDSGASRSFHLRLQRQARGIRSSWSLGFRSTTGSICAGFSEVIFDGRLNNESIRIAAIREISKQERVDLEIQFGLREPEIETTPPPVEVEGAEVEELDSDANGG